MKEISNEPIVPTPEEIFEAYKHEYIRKFNSYPPFKWIYWQSKFETEQDLLKYCIINDKPWYKVIESTEEGQKIDYEKGK